MTEKQSFLTGDKEVEISMDSKTRKRLTRIEGLNWASRNASRRVSKIEPKRVSKIEPKGCGTKRKKKIYRG